MMEGTANFVTRGKGQQIDLSPYLYSFDPDFPEDEVKNDWIFHFIQFFDLYDISHHDNYFQLFLEL